MYSFKAAKIGFKIPAFLIKHCRHASSVKTAAEFQTVLAESIHLPSPVFDLDYFCDPANRLEIQDNVRKRKCRGDIDRVLAINDQLNKLSVDHESYKHLKENLIREISKLPNKLHHCIKDLDEPEILRYTGLKRQFNFKPKEFSDISKQLRIVRSDHLSNFTDHRSYFFMDQLAEMESALVKFSLKNLLSKNFQLISVPDILNKHLIESCGMETEGDRTQVYELDMNLYGKNLCLSGTSEIAIAGFLMNKTFSPDELPLRLTATSRCYRAETSRTSGERGIYRVHQFTKVEMFGVSLPEKSEELLEEFRDIEESMFESLGLHFQTLDMPPCELGNQASRKYDVEAWMPGRNMFGEISSCSNCTDYQSRRLNIKSGNIFVHTLNGTACAVPRLLIALLETHQNKNLTINIPQVLQQHMGGETIISLSNVPKMKLYTHSAHKR
ncbi:seryl-tRNA synthetase, mitochondrial [Lycorma delicatula]|uniref:seryl-tRNA synthetase, mitochondrial n=1 Tax=Lycorma delicatula TaxID=130591 RepID=UPI003F5176DB